ncbi:MAG: haloacid dehalogenase [Candidatus Helarchaeota archaeon]|nr:haloacid dehalogenase [Candidatus Helarchaeota archaeon]
MFDVIFEKIKKKLDIDDKNRETTLKISRQSIRFCQEAVRATHRGEFKKAREKLNESHKLIQEAEENIKKVNPRLYYKGYITDMHQEFVEASLFLTFMEGGTEIPDPGTLNVSNYAYLQGLGDVIGELRRHSLNAVRNEKVKEAENCLAIMEEIYNILHTLDYPEGLIPGIRRKVDRARGLTEKTRSELAYFQHGNKLVKSMNQLQKTLKNVNSDKE